MSRFVWVYHYLVGNTILKYFTQIKKIISSLVVAETLSCSEYETLVNQPLKKITVFRFKLALQTA